MKNTIYQNIKKLVRKVCYFTFLQVFLMRGLTEDRLSYMHSIYCHIITSCSLWKTPLYTCDTISKKANNALVLL